MNRLLVVVALASACRLPAAAPSRPAVRATSTAPAALRPLDAARLSELRLAFNRALDHPRLVALLSPS